VIYYTEFSTDWLFVVGVVCTQPTRLIDAGADSRSVLDDAARRIAIIATEAA